MDFTFTCAASPTSILVLLQIPIIYASVAILGCTFALVFYQAVLAQHLKAIIESQLPEVNIDSVMFICPDWGPYACWPGTEKQSAALDCLCLRTNCLLLFFFFLLICERWTWWFAYLFIKEYCTYIGCCFRVLFWNHIHDFFFIFVLCTLN